MSPGVLFYTYWRVIMIVDKAKIIVSSGRGGDGHVSFRREKFVPAGGPDGGDGGNGGSVILEVDKGQNTLSDFRHVRKFAAESGKPGEKRRRSGKSGKDLIIKVPEGTIVRDAKTGKVIIDMSGETSRFLLLKGGNGGNGNMHYATSTMQAPKYAQPGQPARTIELQLELKLLADVGLVGFPNVGKSTILSMVSGAKPEIANYHFTTLNPILGVVDMGDGNSFVMADIPGIIEGAADGAGLGDEFLAHIERTKVLIHVVDAAGSEGRDPVEDIRAINRELEKYQAGFTGRPQIIAANKCDLIVDGTENAHNLEKIQKYCDENGLKMFPISAATNHGVREMVQYVSRLLAALPEETKIWKQEYNPDTELGTSADAPFTVTWDAKAKEYVVEGPRIEKMLSYTNLETEKGFVFFQKFLAENGIVDDLKAIGCQEGDTVRLYGHKFEFYE